MRRIPIKLQQPFLKELRARRVDPAQDSYYLKWLRFYLDFCAKYEHPPRDPDSLESFLLKLSEKGQTGEQQKQAADSVRIFYDLFAKGTAGPGSSIPGVTPEEEAWARVFTDLEKAIKVRQYSRNTLRTYSLWSRKFMEYLGHKAPAELNSEDVQRFLSHLAEKERVVASTQNQALNAILFLYRHVLDRDFALGDKVVRARRTKYIPVVLTRAEVDRVIRYLAPPHSLVVQLLYGCGLRLFECLQLRVQDLNFDELIITVHDGKGKKDRSVPMPRVLVPALEEQMKHVATLHEKDLARDYDGVFMPGATDRKWRNAPKELIWQWVFPARTLTFVPEENEHRRYHLHKTQVQRPLRAAVRKAKIPKRVSAHTFRHSFASHLLRANYDIRTIQELLGHSDVRTTMIYTHTVQSLKERVSPLDFPPE